MRPDHPRAGAVFDYRCPKCYSREVGYDAISAYDPISETWVLGFHRDTGHCTLCGHQGAIERFALDSPEREKVLQARHEATQQQRASELAPKLADTLREALREVRAFEARTGILQFSGWLARAERVLDQYDGHA